MVKPLLQDYRTDGQAGRRQGTGLWQVFSPNQNSALAASVKRKLFVYARKLKIATDMLGQKRDVTWRHSPTWIIILGSRSRPGVLGI